MIRRVHDEKVGILERDIDTMLQLWELTLTILSNHGFDNLILKIRKNLG